MKNFNSKINLFVQYSVIYHIKSFLIQAWFALQKEEFDFHSA